MLNRSEFPRPEYPRPDHQRGHVEGADWLNLNGPWDFCFDGERTGVDERWFAPGNGPWNDQIIVPFCWESLAAWGQGDSAGNDNYYAMRVFRDPAAVDRGNHRSAPRYEVGWYRREVRIPQDTPGWRGKRVILTVGAADFSTEAWCNGIALGRHEGGYTPFEFDLTEALAADGSGTLVLRVEDSMDNAQQPVGKQWQWYTTTSGIWQTVFVEPRHASHLRPFRVQTDTDQQTAVFEIPCANALDGDVVRIRVHPPEGHPAGEYDVPVRGGAAAGTLAIQPMVLWSHRHPHLYYADLELWREGQVLDQVHTYFGMRKVGALVGSSGDNPAALCLNDRPLYLRGALHQSFYPDGVYTAGDASVFRHDIAFAKSAGFDFLRIHIKIDDPLLLYYADCLGILLMVDFPNFGEGGDTPLGRQRFESMMRAAVERDFNHPSIIAWCLFNETWGFGGQVELVKWMHEYNARSRTDAPGPEAAPAAQGGSDPTNPEPAPSAAPAAADGGGTAAGAAPPVPFKINNQDAHIWVHEMWQLAKQLDPTRLIEDMSVVYWEHLKYYAHTDTDINSWHFYINDYAKARAHLEKVARDTYRGSGFNYIAGFEQGAQPLITSEYGGVGALDGDRDISWSFKFLTNELRRQPKMSAYVFTQLHDVEWEYNGFLNYDRTPKEFGYDPTIINAADVLPVDTPPVRRCQPGEHVRVEVSSSHYGDPRPGKVILQWRLTGIDTVGCIHGDVARGSVGIEFPHLQVAPATTVEFDLPQQTMLCKLTLQAIDEGTGTPIAQNYVEYLVSAAYPLPRERLPRCTVLRGRPRDWSAADWGLGFSDRDAARMADTCYGGGPGFFEWELPLDGINWAEVSRLRVLCEASSHRPDTPQTSLDLYPTTVRILLNGHLLEVCNIPDHPHDARGVLSYLDGGVGAYGYLCQGAAHGDLLRRVCAGEPGHLRLRFEVPRAALAQNGLTLYGPEAGRYPFGPTVIIEH